DVGTVLQAEEPGEEFVHGGHGGRRAGEAGVGERQGPSLPGVEDVRGHHGTLEGGTEGHDAPGVVQQIPVAAQGQGRVRDEAAHGVGDEDQTGRPFVDRLPTGRRLGRVGEPALEVGARLLGQTAPVDLDGQPPVVGERHDRVRVRRGVLHGADEGVVGLDAAQERAPGRGPQQTSCPDAAVVAGPLLVGEPQRSEPVAGQPGPAEPTAVRQAPDRPAGDGVVQFAAHDARDDDDGGVRDGRYQAGFGVRKGSWKGPAPGVGHDCHTSDMLDTGGDVRAGRPDAGDEEPGERVLLTVAVRDYDDEDNAGEFAEGIDRQLDAVRAWWGTPGPLPPFRQVEPPGLRHRDDVEDFLRRENVRELRGLALTLFITGHGIAASADTHFLRLPATEERRPLATAVRTADIIAAALDSHVENVLVIVNTCFAGNLQADLAAVHKEIRASRLASARIDVLGTCGIKTKIEVPRFPTLVQDARRYLRRTAGITTPHLSVPEVMHEDARHLPPADAKKVTLPPLVQAGDAAPSPTPPEFMHEYARHLPPADSKKFKLQHLIQAGDHEPPPCLPTPGYVHVPGQSAAVEQGALSAEYWLDRATGRPQEHDSNWYFRGREELN